MNQTEQAWDMYLSTGTDPTGGDIGPDFDPKTGEYLEDEGCEDSRGQRIEHKTTEDMLDDLIMKLEKMQKNSR